MVKILVMKTVYLLMKTNTRFISKAHFQSNAHSGTKPTQCSLKKYQRVLCSLLNMPVYDFLQCSANVCVYCVQNADVIDTSGHVTKQDQRSYVKIETLRRPLFWTPTSGKCCPTPLFSRHESLFMKLKEPFRGRRFLTLNDLNLAMTRHIQDLNSNGLLDGVKKLHNHWKCVIKAKGDYI